LRSGGGVAAAPPELPIVAPRTIRCHHRMSGHGLRTGIAPASSTDADGPAGGRPIN
jgi:hypothetical protein